MWPPGWTSRGRWQRTAEAGPVSGGDTVTQELGGAGDLEVGILCAVTTGDRCWTSPSTQDTSHTPLSGPRQNGTVGSTAAPVPGNSTLLRKRQGRGR
jgi:hypothetical protein